MRNHRTLTNYLFLVIFFLIFFILIRVMISNEYYSTFLEISIAILSGATISLILIPYTYQETKRIERDEYFKLLFEEIDLIRTKIPEIPDKVNSLRDKWKAFEKNKWIQLKHPVLFPYSASTRFFYQYLPNNAFFSLINRGFIRDIKGFNPKSKDPQYHIISLFYLHCKNASELSERIEDYINVCIDNKPKDNSPSNFFKIHDLVFKWIDSKTIQFTDITEIDSLGRPSSFKEKSWDEFVDEQCNQIIKLFEDLEENIDKKILNYKNYQEFSKDIINDEEMGSSSKNSRMKQNIISILCPFLAILILIFSLAFPINALYSVSTTFLILIIIFFGIIFITWYYSMDLLNKDPSIKSISKFVLSILIIYLLCFRPLEIAPKAHSFLPAYIKKRCWGL
jgi:hypothetical protein